jgi:hypothetical protein
MFSLFPDPSFPVANWISVHLPLTIIAVVALIAFAGMVRFARPAADGCLDDWFGDFDAPDAGGACHD